MKKVIFILGVLVLTVSMTMAQGQRGWWKGQNVTNYDQIGWDNSLTVTQIGTLNVTDINQIGRRQTAIVTQNGAWNHANIIQGKNLCGWCASDNMAMVTQLNVGNTANIFQFGKNGLITVTQQGGHFLPTGNVVNLIQDFGALYCCPWFNDMGCEGNVMTVNQDGFNLKVNAQQFGSFNTLMVNQSGFGHSVNGMQYGFRNNANITQMNGSHY